MQPAQIDVHEPLKTMGFDSLMAVELKAQIDAALGVDIALEGFFEDVTSPASWPRSTKKSPNRLPTGQARRSNTPLSVGRGAGDEGSAENEPARTTGRRPHLASPKGRQGDATADGQARNLPTAPPQPAEIPEEHWQFTRSAEYQQLERQLAQFDLLGIANPFFSLHESVATDKTVVGGREMLHFSSFNYAGHVGRSGGATRPPRTPSTASARASRPAGWSRAT